MYLGVPLAVPDAGVGLSPPPPPPPLPPFAVNDSATVVTGNTVLIPVLANDVTRTSPINVASVVIAAQGIHGTATPQVSGVVNYAADAGIIIDTNDTFSYRVSDTAGRQSNAGQVSVGIGPVSPPPPPPPPPPDEILRLDEVNSSTLGQSITSSTVTPGPNACVLVCMRHRHAVGSPVVPNITHLTPSGDGVFASLTFTLVESQLQVNSGSTVSIRTSVWSCFIPPVTTAGTITVGTSIAVGQRRLELINIPEPRLTGALRQKAGASGTGTTITAILANSPLPDSVVLSFLTAAGSIGALSPSAGYTALSDGSIGTTCRYQSQFDLDNALAQVTLSGLLGSGQPVNLVAVEVAYSNEPEGPPFVYATVPDYTVNWQSLPGVGSISQQTDGVTVTAGTNLAGQDAQHAQIVSKTAFTGDFEFVFDVTVQDSLTPGSGQDESFLFYFLMTGDGSVGHPNDITQWPGATGATRFETNSTGYRMSFDPLDADTNNEDQIRLRDAPALTAILGTGSPNTQPGSFPFVTGKLYHCTVRKEATTFTFSYVNVTDGGTPPTPITVTNALLDDYASGRFIFRAMAGRSARFNVISVTSLTTNNTFVYQPPAGLPVSNADIDVWNIPVAGGSAPANAGAPTRILLAVMPNAPVTGKVTFSLPTYRGIYLIGGVFKLDPIATGGAPSGNRVPIIDTCVFCRWSDAPDWATIGRPYFWISNVVVDYTNIVAGDFLQMGTRLSGTDRATYNFDEWQDLYMQKILCEVGAYGFQNSDVGSGDPLNCHSDFIKFTLGGHRNLFVSDVDVAWEYQTWYGMASDATNFIAHPEATTPMTNVMMRAMPQNLTIYNSGYKRPAYHTIAVNPASPTAGIATGDFSATTFTNVHAAKAYGSESPTVDINDLDAYFDPSSAGEGPYRAGFSGTVVSWPLTTYGTPPRRPITGTVSFTEPATPVVTDAQVGLAKRITTKADLRALFGAVVGPPTNINQDVPDNIAIFNNAVSGRFLTNLDLVGGTGTGTWAKTGWAKASISPLTGQRTVLSLNQNLVPGDNGTKTVTVTYSGDGLPVGSPLTETITIVVSTQPATLPWPSGFSINDDGSPSGQPNPRTGEQAATTCITRINRIETWLGRTIKVATCFNGAESSTWAGVASTLAGKTPYLTALRNKGITPILSVGINQGNDNSANNFNFSNVNAGNYDTQITNCANTLRGIFGDGSVGNAYPVVMRIGWEFNINFPWSVTRDTHPTKLNYKKGFNRVAAIFKARMSHCKIDWCYQQDDKPGAPYETSYPGRDANGNLAYPGAPDLIDICSIDLYDASGRGDTTPVATTDNDYFDWARRPMKVASFARARGKRFAVPEWGLRPLQITDGGGGSDNQYFVQNVYTFLSRMADNRNPQTDDAESGWNIVEYDCYFRIDKNFNQAVIPSAAVHSLFWFNGSTLNANTPFAGPSQHADPGYVVPNGAPAQGLYVSSDGTYATGISTLKYRALFGIPP